MNRLGQILRSLFWLPIVVAGFTGFTFITPGFQRFRVVSVVLLALFVFLGLLQTVFDRARGSLNPDTRDRSQSSQSRAPAKTGRGLKGKNSRRLHY